MPQGKLNEALKLFRDLRTVLKRGNLYDRKHRPSLVVEKAWVKGSDISALALKPSCHMVVTGIRKALEDGGYLAGDGTLVNGNPAEGKEKNHPST